MNDNPYLYYTYRQTHCNVYNILIYYTRDRQRKPIGKLCVRKRMNWKILKGGKKLFSNACVMRELQLVHCRRINFPTQSFVCLCQLIYTKTPVEWAGNSKSPIFPASPVVTQKKKEVKTTHHIYLFRSSIIFRFRFSSSTCFFFIHSISEYFSLFCCTWNSMYLIQSLCAFTVVSAHLSLVEISFIYFVLRLKRQEKYKKQSKEISEKNLNYFFFFLWFVGVSNRRFFIYFGFFGSH